MAQRVIPGAQHAPAQREATIPIAAGTVGTIIEWYDFAV